MALVIEKVTHVFNAPTTAVIFQPGSTPDDKLPPDSDTIAAKLYHPFFTGIVGEGIECSLILSSDDSLKHPSFHRGCAYTQEDRTLWVTSGLLPSNNSSSLPTVLISRISLRDGMGTDGRRRVEKVGWKKLRPPSSMPMPAGACRYAGDGVLYCSQGTLQPESGGLFHMRPEEEPEPVLTSYFHKPFNSIQCVEEDTKGNLWFADSSVGFEQEIRPEPKLPNQVYWFSPISGDVRAVADGFSRPVGIGLSVNQKILYVTDTGAAHPGGNMDAPGSATIYAFDIAENYGLPSLVNRRVFAYVKEGVPSDVMCDWSGNVYAACGDGVEVWNSEGMALGLIEVPGGCTSLCFGAIYQSTEELFICAGSRLWLVLINHHGQS
ncbi:hypothetical protein M426DRAFT_9767 [Hypoxylon sp. CI-4A]|nr:hypothetical protein M426DRAFT_9767 [Hypoxylon sp. CI-4A]